MGKSQQAWEMNVCVCVCVIRPVTHSFSSESKWPIWEPSHQAQCPVSGSLVKTIIDYLLSPQILVSRTQLQISLQSLIEPFWLCLGETPSPPT